VNVEQPEDRGILLKDVLDGVGARELTEREMDYMVRSTNGKYSDRWSYLQKPAENDKALCITANIHKGVPYNICAEPVRVPNYGIDDKSRPLSASYAHKGSGEGSLACDAFPDNPNKQVFDYVAEPVCVAERGRYKADGSIEQHFEAREDGKTNVLTTVQKDNNVCEPVRVAQQHKANRLGGLYGQVTRWGIWDTDGKTPTLCAAMGMGGGHIPMITEPVPCCAIPSDTLKRHRHTMVAEPVNITKDGKSQTIKAQYQNTSVANICCYTSTYGATGVAEPVSGKNCYELDPDSLAKHYNASQQSTRIGRIVAGDKGKHHDSQQYRVYSVEGKSVTLCSSPGSLGKMTGLYAVPIEFDNGVPLKAVSVADGKTYTVYEVKDGFITIKGKRYAIKLADGYYIIRKLTVSECKRLQTVPEWYEFPVSDSQAYKQLGNGWTISVISHLLTACLKPAKDEDELYCDTEGNYRFF
jgi:hypothetical protein